MTGQGQTTRDDTHDTDDVRVSATAAPSTGFTAAGLLAFTLTA